MQIIYHRRYQKNFSRPELRMYTGTCRAWNNNGKRKKNSKRTINEAVSQYHEVSVRNIDTPISISHGYIDLDIYSDPRLRFSKTSIEQCDMSHDIQDRKAD